MNVGTCQGTSSPGLSGAGDRDQLRAQWRREPHPLGVIGRDLPRTSAEAARDVHRLTRLVDAVVRDALNFPAFLLSRMVELHAPASAWDVDASLNSWSGPAARAPRDSPAGG